MTREILLNGRAALLHTKPGRQPEVAQIPDGSFYVVWCDAADFVELRDAETLEPVELVWRTPILEDSIEFVAILRHPMPEKGVVPHRPR